MRNSWMVKSDYCKDGGNCKDTKVGMLSPIARLLTQKGGVAHIQKVLMTALLITLSACGNQIKSQDKPRDYFQRPYLATQESPMPVRTGADKKRF